MNLKLILKDGTEINGESFGYWPKTTSSTTFRKASIGKPSRRHFFADGEVVFNTGMVGYPETFTDPSYRGQILVLTYPMIGNYGVPAESDTHGVSKQFESTKIHLRGLVISEECEAHSHWQAKKSLEAFLVKHKIPAIKGVDTRALTQKLREHGVMLGKIVSEDESFSEEMEFSDPNASNLVAEVSVKKKTVLKPKGHPIATVALIDCGIKHNIIRSFLERGVRVIRLPWNADLSKLREKYDGVFVSNGPGDPETVDKTIENLKWAMKENKVIFGICLGSQVMGLAAGAKTYKLKYGHRSANQPCTDVINDKGQRCYITSQNHGYVVDEKTLPKGWKVWFRNANDGTVEGIKHTSKPWSSVQFHPEASPGPEDAAYLFDKFIDQMIFTKKPIKKN
ncbi:glutamine-hydrolyzing carbamoyl-phosphate synthase small subunit [Patescibacteria group bacterium]|nr:glutamine-hydrolyzing carbamoyl-phosphate synthase small subunit [Patescibacteria group bacterium]MBU1016004.1 glutamine-hydrolyzing carbamoyl-phosphate synthase small subunit [Patescibacteria group bacterium]MBU1684629.1 glutamine-hydrolyzing carbamoyl-phosphate synthase small subunit [Patescibacteria group bacterium]MBU1939069.1 glutamine-hydrolyzing carbamoyl-phosphate synthase small subunit [Patescibacteria group bacterium]